MSSGNVNITDLPAEMLLHIFTFLDAEGLIACAGVNATWKEVTNSMGNKIWFQACLKAGIYVKEDKHENARDWKAFLSSMLPRLKAMKDSTCFATDQYDDEYLIKAIYCHKDKIALAFSNKIQIRNVCEEEILKEFESGFEPTHLKFDDKILVAVSEYGNVSTWSMTTGRFLGGYNDADESNSLLSFDFLTDHDIVASSHLPYQTASFIRIWSRSCDNFCTSTRNERNLIESVMLAPNRDLTVNEQEITCYLLSATIDYVDVATVTLRNRNLSARSTALFRIPLNPSPQFLLCILMHIAPRGLLFDGNEVYITSLHFQFSSRSICAWNFRTNSRRFLGYEGRMTKLLGVGEKYIVYEVELEDNSKRVVVANKITAEIIATIRMQRSTVRRYADHLCLADTSWLDGINGENDRGVVCARIAEDKLSVQVALFIPRNE